MSAVLHLAALQGECHGGARRRRAAERAEIRRGQLRRAAARGRRPAAGVRGAARRGARHQEPHARASRPLSRGLRASASRARAARCTGRVTAEDAARDHPRHLPQAGAKTVTKGKSMIGEEIGINDHPRGERHRRRSRPISANTSSSSATSCRAHHRAGGASHQGAGRGGFPPRPHRTCRPDRDLAEPPRCWPRRARVLREKFLAADVGITGANFLIAETGSSIIVTNEGNGDLTQTLPQAHIVLACIEKIVPTLEDAAQILRLLARSATGQDMSVYTTFSTGPRRAERSRRAGRISRRPARQRPLGDARRRVPATCCAASAAAPA